MCGIVGQFGTSIDETWINQELVNLRHRGPDNQSSMRISDKLMLGSTRLAMTDPSPRSNQPMFSDLRKSVITFNGEIYNYKDLRKKLQKSGVVFRTESDTEVLLKWLDIYGVSGLNDLNGMYALAYYSTSDRKLILARDRLGKKPLYTLLLNNNLYWSSSIESLQIHLESHKLDRYALYQYFSLGYTLDPNSILNCIQAVKPGEAISYSEDLISLKRNILPKTQNSSTDLRTTLISAVKSRVEGHTNIALSLSGGLDSTIMAIALNELNSTYKTYSAIWFDSDKMRYNTDAILAKEISRKLGVENFQIQMINAKDLPLEIDKYVGVMGEPNNNPSGISMLKLYEEISRDGNRLVITGDGADELFAGYARYLKTSQVKKLFNFPSSFQARIAMAERNHKSRILQNFASSQMHSMDPLKWLHWHWVFRPNEISTLMPGLFNTNQMVGNLSRTVNLTASQFYGTNAVEILMSRDSDLWLANESNRKLDRISMNYSIEARSPFQDDEVIAHAQLLMRKYDYKLLNKEIIKNVFPETANLGVREDKAGFTSPVGHWLRGNPEFLANSLRDLKKYEIFSKAYIESLILAPATGSYQKIMQCWTLLVFSRWIETLGIEVDV